MIQHKVNNVSGGDVGINYGRRGSNLPSPTSVANFLTNELRNSISLIRISDANPEVLEVLKGTNLVVSIEVPNEEVPSLAASKYNAITWVNLNIRPFANGVRFRYIAVGSELIPGGLACQVLPAMSNLREALVLAGLTEDIRITTVVPINALSKSYPPSSGEFAPEVAEIMKDVSSFLYSIGSPLMINVYPYFSLVAEPDHIALDYALFRSQAPVVIDGPYEYYNLFDAMVDAFGAAVARAIGKEDVRLVVAQTGWPTNGETPFSCVENARVYNNNLKKHAREIGRTPRLGQLNLEAYILGMFDEDLNPVSTFRSFGTFYPNLTQVYPLWIS